MYLHNVPSSYGRLVPKPESNKLRAQLYEDNVSVQDQIENLRVKISLKERYNKVLKDELEESRQGTTTVIHDLIDETKNLRIQFYEAINIERSTVQKALRTHHNFQLAMRRRVTREAIQWLDDKLFDIAKQLNCVLYRLHSKRKQLEEVELAVEKLEKFPRPGTLPWEVDAADTSLGLEYKIENTKVKYETARILHSKYYEIKFILREERGKYDPVLRALENQFHNQRKELAQLQKMSADATIFQMDSARKLVLTEQEASENRRRRKKQMIKMKKAVTKILDSAPMLSNSSQARVSNSSAQKRMSFGDKGEDMGHLREQELVWIKSKELERFQERSRRLVETMKVKDLTHIPIRYQTVFDLGRRFDSEQKAKQTLRDTLLRQQNMLNLILCHFLYTGQREEGEFNDQKRSVETQMEQNQTKIKELTEKMQTYGQIIVDVRLAMLALIERFEDPPKQRKRFCDSDLKTQLKVIHKKVDQLVTSVKDLEKEIPVEEDDSKQYQLYMRPNNIPLRLIRVGTPVKEEDSDADDEFADLKVPGRKEIKAKSLKFLNHHKLKRGIQ